MRYMDPQGKAKLLCGSFGHMKALFWRVSVLPEIVVSFGFCVSNTELAFISRPRKGSILMSPYPQLSSWCWSTYLVVE